MEPMKVKNPLSDFWTSKTGERVSESVATAVFIVKFLEDLIKKLDRVENTLFEFWSAKMVNYNCYGPFVIDCERANYVVARYETDKETYMGYGTSIEAARAYLGLKLYDEYKDVINAIACKNKVKKTSR